MDLAAGEHRLPDTNTGPRTISLAPEAVGGLSLIPRWPENPFMIPDRIKGKPMRNLNDPWEIICARAGLTDNPRLVERASLMTRAKKRDINRGELHGLWERQATDLGLDAGALVAEVAGKSAVPAWQATAEPPTGPDRAGKWRPLRSTISGIYSDRALRS